MNWIYLSPHLDDVIFSCGGLVWDQVQAGDRVEIWTVCAGYPPPLDLSSFAEALHARWGLGGDIIAHRREEDNRACQVLGAVPKHFRIPDCIYRQSPLEDTWLYTSEDAIFGGLDPVERPLVDSLSLMMAEKISNDDHIVTPLGVGNHVDHELTRKAAYRLDHDLFYYADYPYAREEQNQYLLRVMGESDDWQSETSPISSSGLSAWQKASLCYQSQIEVFWKDEREMLDGIRQFSSSMAGVTLWRPAGKKG